MIRTSSSSVTRKSGSTSLAWLFDFEQFARTLIYIRNKQEQMVRLRLNPMQRTWFAQATNRTITLKARQHGISTGIEARMYHRACTRPGYRGVIIAQDQETTERLREKVRLMHRMHASVGPAPQTRNDSKAEVVFSFGAGQPDSTIYIGTAGARAFGRGDTVSEVHASELAFWPDPQRILTGLMEAVPQSGEIHIESTANGFNYFYELCDESRKGQGSFRFVFLPWYVNPEYKRTPGVPTSAWTDDERVLAQKAFAYQVMITGEQIAFRREKQRDLKGLFAQEYAEDPDTCFLLSGRARFDNVALNKLLPNCKPPIKVTEFKDTLLTLRQWEEPQAGKLYVIGADAAQGLAAGDWDAACIADWATGRQVAELYGKAEIFNYADKLALVGYLYNTAWLNVERKESGIGLLAKLLELNYPRLFYLEDENGEQAKDPGYPTNRPLKTRGVDAIDELLTDAPEAFTNREEVVEMMRFVIKEGDRMEAEQGAHDDRVAARWCEEMARRQVRPPRTERLPRRPGTGRQL